MKKFVALFLVVLISIESFAAVVSDNDGAAFVTKAEFDSLIANFQSQIDSYNSGIDSKIDGAIAGYIEGVKNQNEETLTNATSLLSYPINIHMNNKKVFDIDNWDTGRTGTVWAPNWNWRWIMMWGWGWTPDMDGSTTTNASNVFLNITKDNTGDYVGGVTNVVNNSIKAFGFAWHWNYDAGSDNVRARKDGVIYFGVDNWPTVQTEWSNNSGYQVTYQNDYISLFELGKPGKQDLGLKFGVCMAWARSAPCRILDGTYPYQKVASDYTWVYPRADFGDYFSSTIQTEGSEFKDIINGRSNKEDFVQVMHNNMIYLTNQNWKRRLLCNRRRSNMSLYWNAGRYETSYNCIAQIIDPGYVIEPVGHGKSDRDKYEKSLWNINDIDYYVTLPISKKRILQNMTKGVLLTEIPSGNVKDAKIDIQCTFPQSISPKIIFSDSEIGDTSLQTTLDNGYILGKVDDTSEETKALELTNGDNKIAIKNLKGDSRLYYKVFFDEESTETILIEEPRIRVTVES